MKLSLCPRRGLHVGPYLGLLIFSSPAERSMRARLRAPIRSFIMNLKYDVVSDEITNLPVKQR